MHREFLEDRINRGMSLKRIAAEVGKHHTTVAYWLAKYGIQRAGSARYHPRGGLSREQLEPLVAQGLTKPEIAKALDRSVSTVHLWMKRHGLRVKASPRAELARAARERGQTRFLATCHKHGEAEFLAFANGRSRCSRCNAEGVTGFRRHVKRTLVAEAGGRCRICGYDRTHQALQFHHVDPNEKLYTLSDAGISRSLEDARSEARKCVLLCANCHAEVEAGLRAVALE